MCHQRPLLLLLLMLLLLPALPLPLFPPPYPSLPPSLSAGGSTQGARWRFSGTRRTAASVDGGGGGVREGMRGIISVAYTALKRRPHRMSCRKLGGRGLTRIFLNRILKSQCPSTFTM